LFEQDRAGRGKFAHQSDRQENHGKHS
jgi:hypothetical protein